MNIKPDDGKIKLTDFDGNTRKELINLIEAQARMILVLTAAKMLTEQCQTAHWIALAFCDSQEITPELHRKIKPML